MNFFTAKKHHFSDAIYLDYMASTPVAKPVLQAISDYHKNNFGNPHSNHSYGVKARKVFDESLNKIGKILAAPAGSLTATSGATESNAIALQGVIDRAINLGIDKPHVIISEIEHATVAGIKKLAESEKIELDYITVDNSGIIEYKKLLDLIKPNTILVSVMLVNSEIGTVQPLNELSREIRRWQKKNLSLNNQQSNYPLLHTDASQAFLTQEIKLNQLHVDLLTLNGHKIYAPIGTGLLYIRPTIKGLIQPIFISNYETEFIRPGTSAPANALALATAMSMVEHKRADFVVKAQKLFEYLAQELTLIGGQINGSTVLFEERSPHNISVSFENINHEFLQFQLDAWGISVATRSACLESGGEGSRVLQHLDTESDQALRISFGYETEKKDLQILVTSLKKAIDIQQSV
jgi:cysteine desulfurase